MLQFAATLRRQTGMRFFSFLAPFLVFPLLSVVAQATATAQTAAADPAPPKTDATPQQDKQKALEAQKVAAWTSLG